MRTQPDELPLITLDTTASGLASADFVRELRAELTKAETQRDAARTERDRATSDAARLKREIMKMRGDLDTNNQDLRRALIKVLDDHAKHHPLENVTGPYQAARDLLRTT